MFAEGMRLAKLKNLFSQNLEYLLREVQKDFVEVD